MENRFLEMDSLLQSGNGNGSVSNGIANGISFSRSNEWSKPFSTKNSALVILIENGGIDLGIPELAEKIMSALHVGAIIPDNIKQQFINALRDKIKELTDNLIETAELAINRYKSAAPDLFSDVIVLRDSTASYQELKNTLIKLTKENKITDLLILTHGGNDVICVKGDIRGQQIKDIKAELGRPLSIRSVYMMNCVGSSLNQAWIDAGAKVSSGAIRNNYLPEPTTYFFWKNWKEGQNFENAVTGAYRKTINLMNDAVKSILGRLPLMASYAAKFTFEDFDFVKDSAPVIQGLRSVTINSDNLTFSQSTGSSNLATTVLPVSVLQSLQTARAFSNGNVHSWSLSQQGINLIKSFEAFKSKMYNDPVGHCTIGYGTLLHKGNCNGDGSEQPYTNGVTEDQATQLLKKAAGEFEKIIKDGIKPEIQLNQNQYDALVSFVYNVGGRAFTNSTLLKELNNGNYDRVPGEMKKWVKGRVNGELVELPGLVARRKKEAELFQGSVAVSQSVSGSMSAVDYTVPGPMEIIKQPSDMTCWAAVMAMMFSWRRKQSLKIKTVMTMLGPVYVEMFEQGKGLDPDTAEQLYKDAGLATINSFNPTIEGWAGLLKNYGLLYVDIGYSGMSNTHAIIVTGITGDGTSEGTKITYIDPAEGKLVTTTFKKFQENYEAPGAVKWPYTIVHWPENKSISKSMSNYSRPFYDTGEHAILGEFINMAVSGPIATVKALQPSTTYTIGKVPFTYGQIITMGDFYTSEDNLLNADAHELNRLKTLIIRSENHYKNSILGIGPATSDVGNKEWGSAEKGIGSRYIDLALINNSHFAPPPAGTGTTTSNNKETWEHCHAKAIKLARSGKNMNDAYVINAFGDHFLTDAFSAGHLVNKELVMTRFLDNVLSNGHITSKGEKLLERIADGALKIPAVNKMLGRFEVKTDHWYEVNWDLNDTGALYPEVFYRILVKVLEDTAHEGNKKIANLAVKAAHDALNTYKVGEKPGVPVINKRSTPWKLTGDTTLNEDNIKIIQLAVKQSVENLEDSIKNTGTADAVYYQKVWDYVPRTDDPTTTGIVNDIIKTYTDPSSEALVKKAINLVEVELPTLLDELLKANRIRCIKKHDAKSVSECERA